MYFVQGSELIVHQQALLLPTYKAMVAALSQEQLIQINLYAFFVYTTRGINGRSNIYSKLDMDERITSVCNEFFLFKKPADKKLLEIPAVQSFLALYRSTQVSEIEEEILEYKKSYNEWRVRLKECIEPKDVLSIKGALEAFRNIIEECERRLSLEGTDTINVDGCPLYLFEIPEALKPAHLKIRINGA